LEINSTLTVLDLKENPLDDRRITIEIYIRLRINITNEKRSRCLQILCLKKLKQLNRIDEIKFFNPIIYDSCTMKYRKSKLMYQQYYDYRKVPKNSF